MNKRTFQNYWAVILCGMLALFTLTISAFAQTNAVSLDAPAVQTVGKSFSYWQMIIPIAVPLIIGLFKMLLPNINPKYLPAVAPLLGMLIDGVLQFGGLYSANPLIGLALGSAGVGLRELKDQLSKQTSAGLSGIRVALFLLLFTFFVGLGGLVGCASTHPDAIAYKVEKATDLTITAAMSAWNDYIGKYHPPIDQQIKVRDAYRKYVAAMLVLTDAGQTYTSAKIVLNGAKPTNNITPNPAESDELNAALASASAALGDVLGLIQTFSVKH